MLKTLRKHNKWFMVIFGSLLMMTFLVDQGVSGASNVGKRVVAETRDGKIRLQDLQKAQGELEILNEACPAMLRSQLGVEGPMHWILLVNQAERLGLIGDELDGMSWLPELSQSEVYTQRLAEMIQRFNLPVNFARSFLERQMPQIMKDAEEYEKRVLARQADMVAKGQITSREYGAILSKLRGVHRTSRLYIGAATFSDRKALSQIRRDSDVIKVNAVVIPAASVIASIPEPSPERLQAHFDQYRSVKPGTGAQGFGYILEPRLKVEWFRVSREAISANIVVDPIDAHKHWQKNRTRFPGEFDAEEAAVVADIKNSKIETVMSTASRVMKDRVRASLSRLPVDGPYRKLPDTWDQDGPKLATLAQEVADAVKTAAGLSISVPPIEKPVGDWIDLSKADSLAGLGESFFRAGQSRMGFAQMVGMIKEINPQTTLDLQARVPFTTVVMENQSGDHFYFNVVEVKPEAAPDTIDQVRDRVLADVKRLDGFDKLKTDLETNRALVAQTDLKTLAIAFKKPTEISITGEPLEVVEEIQVTRTAVANAECNTEDFRNAVFAAAGKLGEVIKIEPANAADRTVAVALPDSLSVVVAQISGQRPVVLEDLRMMSPFASDSLATSELAAVLNDKALKGALSFDVLAEAASLREVGAKAKDEEAEGEKSAQAN